MIGQIARTLQRGIASLVARMAPMPADGLARRAG
ncbi:hypothetical protein M2440_001946 [Methylorubrum extorquens]|nr:hypothetical protein [Methylorubrum extorquens]